MLTGDCGGGALFCRKANTPTAISPATATAAATNFIRRILDLDASEELRRNGRYDDLDSA
jgi:hypothetical protein